MHGAHFTISGFSNMNIKRLRLIDERRSRNSKINHLPLTDFPGSFIQFLKIIRNLFNILHRTIISNQLILNINSP